MPQASRYMPMALCASAAGSSAALWPVSHQYDTQKAP